MSGSVWKTGAAVMHAQPVVRPTGRQIARQLILLGLLGLIGLGLVLIVLSATGVAAGKVIVVQGKDQGPASGPAVAPPPGTPTAVSFSHDVLPIFTSICMKCHGGARSQNGLVLKTYDDVMAGSDNGYVIEPGDPASSVLIEKITTGKMPKNSPHLLPSQIRTIWDWVQEGAPDN
jgi:hypothetical protein